MSRISVIPIDQRLREGFFDPTAFFAGAAFFAPPALAPALGAFKRAARAAARRAMGTRNGEQLT